MKSIIKTIVLLCGSSIVFYLLFLFAIHIRPAVFLNMKTPLEKQSLEKVKTLNNIVIKLEFEDTLYELSSLNYLKNKNKNKNNRDSLYLFLFLSNEIQKTIPTACNNSKITAQFQTDRYNYTLICDQDQKNTHNLNLHINKNTIQENFYKILLQDFFTNA